MKRPLQLLHDVASQGPTLDTALSRALLEAVAQGQRPETLRIWRPDDALAFSLLDRARAGFDDAVEVAAGQGFEPFLRLAGGHAAAYTTQTLAFAWTTPIEDVRIGIRERFDEFAALVVEALRELGLDARVGAVPGEYCPGDHSVNAGGRVKLMGVGQRVIRGAAYLGGVIVVADSGRARAALEPVYEALGLPFTPETVGSVAEEGSDLDWSAVADALLAAVGRRCDVEPVGGDASLVERARALEARFRVHGSSLQRGASSVGAKLVSESS